MRDRLGVEFELAVEWLIECTGKVVVTGMGKSGHIATKIAATLASTGTPAFFVHPAELRHGDFGMLEERDIIIALSSSGETQEIKVVLDPIKRLGLKLIAFTGNTDSSLAKAADVVLDVGVDREACPLNLAPTSSTTAALAMGDALALVLMSQKGFEKEDFARSHPGGNLGKQLLSVADVMRSGIQVPTVGLGADHSVILDEIDKKKLGFTAVVDDEGQLHGVITDGDLRRSTIKFGQEIFAKTASELMTKNPKTIASNCLAVAALKAMEQYSIADLLILDEQGRPIGLIDLKDLLKAGII
ncbi:MAG: KpsF/GutQ family sugar-phosphate isomerase [Candidatus Obscuribacterales bacterium]|nr:KpsF/GutQ family sugar-phosphate isomerase [Candidatus Obscuribacterales bacterium]